MSDRNGSPPGPGPTAPGSEAPEGRTWRGPLVAAFVVIAVLGTGIAGYLVLAGDSDGRPVRTKSSTPNIVLILTDDQRWDMLGSMPILQRLLVGHGVTFTNSFVDTPICCPSRVSTLTGAYPQRTGVWLNSGAYGGFQSFRHDGSTMATWLHARAYHTALFGKYLNKYNATTYVPPGWNRWAAFVGERPSTGEQGFYYHYDLNVDGKIRRFGTEPADYSTNVLADMAVSYVRETDSPLLMYFAPSAPHPPAVPAAQDAGRFRNLPPYRPPSYNEADVSDKPLWVHRAKLTPQRQAGTDLLRQRMIESLQSVDRAVGRIVQAFADTGRLANTMFVYTSDNGFSLGEHRWRNKYAAWEEDIRVPMVIRYDPLTPAPRRDPHLVSNIDLAPTFAALAGAVPASPVDGRSLLPLLEGTTASWRTGLLAESLAIGGGARIPAYCALQTTRYIFVAYASGETELYDLTKDPYQLSNIASVARFHRLATRLHRRLAGLCRPPPPLTPAGFP